MINPAFFFIEHLLIHFENSFNVSFKLTAICDYLRQQNFNKSPFSSFYSKIFGIQKYDMISNENFIWIVTFRKNVQKILSNFIHNYFFSCFFFYKKKSKYPMLILKILCIFKLRTLKSF